MVVSPAAYGEQLKALMPQGRAWPIAPASVLARLLEALGGGLSRLDGAATAFLDESLASRAFDLLPEWEEEFGLPDKCSSLAPTIPERRASVVNKMVTRETASLAEVRRLAALYGITVRVSVLDQTRAGAIAGIDASNGRWRYVWWATIPTDAQIRYFTTLSDVNEPLASWDGVPGHAELECRLREIVPAHTYFVIGYHSVVSFDLGTGSLDADWTTWNGAWGPLPTTLTGGATRYLRRISIRENGSVVMHFSEAAGSPLSESGDDLADTWEMAEDATVLRSGDLTLRLPGPNAAVNQVRDSGESYFFTPPADIGYAEFYAGQRAQDAAVRATATVTLTG